MYTIEKNIPIEDSGDSLTSIFHQMDIGDSIVMPTKKRGVCTSVARHAGIKIKTKKCDNEKIRVWRIA